MTIQTLKVQSVVDTIRTWSPPEQIELIQAITKLLEDAYNVSRPNLAQATSETVLLTELIHHSPPMIDLDSFVADFWPEDESADEINTFVYLQRQEDLQREL